MKNIYSTSSETLRQCLAVVIFLSIAASACATASESVTAAEPSGSAAVADSGNSKGVAESGSSSADTSTGDDASLTSDEAIEVLQRNKVPLSLDDPWRQFWSSELTWPDVGLEHLRSLANAVVLVTDHSIDDWYQNPAGPLDLPDGEDPGPGFPKDTYLRLRLKIEVIAGSLPKTNPDGSIFLDLLMPPGTEIDDPDLRLPPPGYGLFVTATELLQQNDQVLIDAVGKGPAAEFTQRRHESYIVTTRAGLVVAHGNTMRAPLLEADLTTHSPDEFFTEVDRGIAPPNPDAVHEQHGESFIPQAVFELDELDARAFVKEAKLMTTRSSEEVRRTMAEFRARTPITED